MGNIKKKNIVLSLLGIFGHTLLFCLMLVVTMMGFAVSWLFRTWNNLTADELIFHLQVPLEGTNTAMVRDFIKSCVLPAVSFTLIFWVIFLILKFFRKKYLLRIWIAIMIMAVAASGGYAGIRLWNNLEFGTYFNKQGEYSELIDEFYVDPEEIAITFPDEKRNLIYIYLESMEITYADQQNGGGFKENYIPELTVLAQENEDFSGENKKLNGGYVVSGTGFTMGAIFGQSSGIPMKVSIDGNSMGTRKTFFSGVVTLGDILEEQGYQQTFILGSEASFAAKDKFFEEHGDYKIIDYLYAKESGLIPEGYKVWWGYEDRRAFAFAKEELLEMSKSGKPFNLTMLTVDTHFEDGYVCELCENQWNGNQYANVVSCSSSQVYDFVEWVKDQDFYENTTIVLVGDHTTMDKDFCDPIVSDYPRKVYTAYINSAVSGEVKEEREYCLLDYFPTTLASLGANIEGNRLGLGTNLFSHEQTLLERFGIDVVEEELEKNSRFMEKLEKEDES